MATKKPAPTYDPVALDALLDRDWSSDWDNLFKTLSAAPWAATAPQWLAYADARLAATHRDNARRWPTATFGAKRPPAALPLVRYLLMPPLQPARFDAIIDCFARLTPQTALGSLSLITQPAAPHRPTPAAVCALLEAAPALTTLTISFDDASGAGAAALASPACAGLERLRLHGSPGPLTAALRGLASLTGATISAPQGHDSAPLWDALRACPPCASWSRARCLPPTCSTRWRRWTSPRSARWAST